MNGFRQVFGRFAGVALGASAAVLLAAAPLAAQTPPPAGRNGAASTDPGRTGLDLPETAVQPSTASRSRGQGPAVDDSGPLDGIAPAIPAGDPSQDPADPSESDDPRPGAGERTAVRDGDLSAGEEQTLVRDGIVDVGEPLPPQDGGDPTVVDSRAAEEAALFANPPSEPDPLLFQIEDIDPVVTDRRPERLFRTEPYDPIGIRIGSFVYFPETEIGGLYQSNIQRTADANDDIAAEIRTNARLVSDWNTHALEFSTTGLYTFHDEFDGEDDRAWGVEGRGRLDITRLTNLQGLLSHNQRQEGRSGIDANTTGDRAEVKTDDAALTLNHRFNRLSVQLRGAVTDTDYGDTEAATVGAPPSTGSNDDRDFRETREAVRASYELKPTLSVFSEVEINQRDYDAPSRGDNLLRTSDGERTRVGVDFGTTGDILRGEASLGWGRQNPENAALSDVQGVLVDANLAWRVSDLTTLRFTARTDIFDTNTANSAGVVSHQFGIEARHAFLRYLIGTAGLTYTDQNYDNVEIDENELRAALGLEYYFNREWTAYGRYEHINFRSNQPGSDWVSDDVRLGLRWRR